MQTLTYSTATHTIVENSTGEVIMYGDTIPSNVLEAVTQMINNKEFSSIKQYLDNTSCVTEEKDFILESLHDFIKTDDVFPDNLGESESSKPEQEKELSTTQGNTSLAVNKISEEKEKRQYTRRVQETNKNSGKIQSTEDFIKLLQEKIEMAKLLDLVTIPDVPTTMSKPNREILIEFQKEHSAMVAKYIQKIQQS